jgi:hypothetical protein
MRKTALTVLLFLLTFGVAGAASVNGDFEGNPIVKVQSGGQELKVEDVPATIYKGRTVVPVYLLRQLGANVAWNADTYTVNITLPADTGAKQPQPQSQPDSALQERALLKNAYEWLKDTDAALVLFVQELQQFAAMDMDETNSTVLEQDYTKLKESFDASLQMALKVQSQVQDYAGLRSIIDSESKTLDQITQAKNLVKLKQTVSGTDLTGHLPLVLLNATRSALQNQLNTNDILHKLQAQEMKLDG